MFDLISSLKSFFLPNRSPPGTCVVAVISELDFAWGSAVDEEQIEHVFDSQHVVGGKQAHESLDCGDRVELVLNSATGAVVSVTKIAGGVPEQGSSEPSVAEVDEKVHEIFCVVRRVDRSPQGDVVHVDGDNDKYFTFDLRSCRGNFRPKTDDELIVTCEVQEDGQEWPVRFDPAKLEEWPEACVVKEARFGSAYDRRRPDLGAVRYRNKEATFDAYVVKGSKFQPRCDEVVYARVIGTNDRFRPWRAVDVKTRTLGLQAGAMMMHGCLEGVEPAGLFVEEEIDFGFVKPERVLRRAVSIKNDTERMFTLLCVTFDDPMARKIFSFVPNKFPVKLRPKTTYHMTLVCNRGVDCEIPASDTLPLRFRFTGDVNVDRMVHAKFLELENEDQRLFQSSSRAPRPRMPRKWASFDAYSVPNELWNIVRSDGDVVKLFPILTAPLTPEVFVGKMKVLIYLQHVGEAVELSKFKLTHVVMERKGEYLTLVVPDLKEGRPSVVETDMVVVSGCRRVGGATHEGRIVEIRDSTLSVQFARVFHDDYRGEPVDVSFKVSYAGYTRGHHAVNKVDEKMLKQLVFPVKEDCTNAVMKVADEGLFRPLRRPDDAVRAQRDSFPMFSVQEEVTQVYKLRWFNIDLNERQRQAVKFIVASESRIPYLIFGPPGTGKTVTVVEAVMQVMHMDPSSRIMIATPSNSAADLICSRLDEYVDKGWLEKTRMVRYLAKHRDLSSFPDRLRDYLAQDDLIDEAASNEIVNRIKEARIVIATWHMCGSLHLKSIPSNFFTHVFIDEAGHLTEPECLVPMTLCDAKRVILAGDPEQLGPVIMSEPAKRFGMCRSLLERLMRENTAYLQDHTKHTEFGGYDPSVVTKLVENYRSQPKILELYSNLCYAGELVPRVEDDGVPRWIPETLKDRFPLLVVGVRGGVCMRENKNPSPFNEIELFYVHLYAVMLTGRGISPQDVGVVTPYRRQAQKIREKFRDSELADVKVGSVEEFQGSERRVIIVSTVQTTKTADGKRRWKDDLFWANSFFSSKRHTNVAISRAQDFLVVIGDVDLLTRDEFWGQILSKARQDGDKHFLLVGQRS